MRDLSAGVVIAVIGCGVVSARAAVTVSTPPETIVQTVGGTIAGPASFATPFFSSTNLGTMQSPATITPLNGQVQLQVVQDGTDPNNRIDQSQSNIQWVTDPTPGEFQFATSAASYVEADYLLASGGPGAADIKITSNITKTVQYTTDALQSFLLNATFLGDTSDGAALSSMAIDVSFVNAVIPPFHADSAHDAGLSTGEIWLPAGTTVVITTAIDTSAALHVSGVNTNTQMIVSSFGDIVVGGYVPEPGTLGLAAVGGMALLARRGKR